MRLAGESVAQEKAVEAGEEAMVEQFVDMDQKSQNPQVKDRHLGYPILLGVAPGATRRVVVTP
ncbi:MAG: hypothetical protein WAN12_15890 [Candidatus Acidiferrum sp.]